MRNNISKYGTKEEKKALMDFGYSICNKLFELNGVSLDLIRSHNNKQEIATYRHMLAYTLSINGLDEYQIGEIIYRERTSALHSISVAKNYIKTNDPIIDELSLFINYDYKKDIL